MSEENFTATDRGNLDKLERVGEGTVVASEIFGLVGKSQFFTEFSKEDISTLAGYMEVYRAQPGEILIREGDEGDRFYVIDSGQMTASFEGAVLRQMGPGDPFGENSVCHTTGYEVPDWARPDPDARPGVLKDLVFDSEALGGQPVHLLAEASRRDGEHVAVAAVDAVEMGVEEFSCRHLAGFERCDQRRERSGWFDHGDI